MGLLCNFSLALIAITEGDVQCNSQTYSNSTLPITIFGSNPDPSSVVISNAEVHLLLETTGPLTAIPVEGSCALFTLRSSTHLRQIGCSDSNISFLGIGDGFLNVDASTLDYNPGIGSIGECESINFINATVHAQARRSAGAIGTSGVTNTVITSINSLIILDGNITAIAGTDVAPFGIGFGGFEKRDLGQSKI